MRFFTAKEVAKTLQLPLARVYELVRLGILPAIHIGERQIRFSEEALQKWIASGGSKRPTNH